MPDSQQPTSDLPPRALEAIDAYWRAANYLSAGQIFLWDNPLLREPLAAEHIKPRLLGHWGTCPGINFVYAHLNEQIRRRHLDMLMIPGPGHGGPAAVANAYLEGNYSALYPEVAQNEEGLRRLFKQFSFPGGLGSHVSPHVPGSIQEGGELGYSLAHAFGAAFDHPDLIVCCLIGDGEAETGPLAASWHSNKFLNPARDGAVLPVLHLNEYKISNPTLLARIGRDKLTRLLEGYGYAPIFVEGSDPDHMHGTMARALDGAVARIQEIQTSARSDGSRDLPDWPLIVLQSPKGWTGPVESQGEAIEGSFRAHQVPLSDPRGDPEQLRALETWMKRYRPEELFDSEGGLTELVQRGAPPRALSLSANPVANGGRDPRDLELPEPGDFALPAFPPGQNDASATKNLGRFLRAVMDANTEAANFRVVCPDEIHSNGLSALMETTDRAWMPRAAKNDSQVSADGRVMEVLSEHLCQGWLEGYTLTGRHGLFACYEAFIHLIDSMFNQHAKWLKRTREISWREPIPSLNYLLTSHVWRQDHNGFTHQDPGFLNHAANKKPDVVRIYLPPDANTLLAVIHHCLGTRHYINVTVAGKHEKPQWLDWEDALEHCRAGASVWPWAGSEDDDGEQPDIVMACAGDVPTLETLAAVQLMREIVPDWKVRVVNVVDLMCLLPPERHPHGLSSKRYEALFGADCPVVFNFHGYPSLIHELTYKRSNHTHLHVHGYEEEGTTTTPFDMAVRNRIDRYHLIRSAARHLSDARGADAVTQFADEKLTAHREHITREGLDLPEVAAWQWKQA